jgi:hypothetical protein
MNPRLALGILALAVAAGGCTPSQRATASTQSKVTINLTPGDTVVIVAAGDTAHVPPPVDTTKPPPVDTTKPPITGGSYHEPAGFVRQISTGGITAAPACGSGQGSWTVNGAGWSMFSTSSTTPTGENCHNLTLVSGHTGYAVHYPSTIVAGNSPVRFGTGIPQQGTGNLYVRFNYRAETGYTTNGNPLIKYMEPRTPQQGPGATQQNDVIAGSINASNSEAWVAFLQQGSTVANLPPYGYQSPYDPAKWFVDSAANLGSQHTNQWQRVELLLTPESPLGTRTGHYTVWVNGKQELLLTNVPYFASGNTAAWNYFMFDPVYGGTKAPSPGGVAWDFDSLYVSTK